MKIKTLKYINLFTLILFILSALIFIIFINLLNRSVVVYICFIFHIILALTGYFISLYFLFRYIKINSFRQQINYNHIQESKFIQESQETVENKTLNFLLKELIPEHDNNKPVDKWADEILSKITKQIEVVQALLYIHKEKDSKKFVLTGKYAFYSDKGIEEIKEFTEGEGIIGRVAIKREPLITDQIPQKNIMVLSGLGSGPPRYMAVIPILYSDECIGIIQLFAFRSFDKNLSDSFIEIGNLIGEKLYSYLDYK